MKGLKPLFFIVIGTVLLFSIWIGILMQGQPFFDTDYDWIRIARGRTWQELIQKIFLPQTTWEFEDRPGVQVFLKIFDSITVWNPLPIQIFKSVIYVGTMIAIICFGIALREPVAGLVAAILWASTSNTLCSILWLNDMAVWTQFIGMYGTLLFLRWTRNNRLSFIQWLCETSVWMFLIVFSFSVKGNARLFPVVWCLGWLFSGCVKPHRFIPLFVVLFIYTIPLDFKPPFLSSSHVLDSHLVQPARLSQMVKLTFSDAVSTTMEPVSFLGAIGPIFWIFGVAGLVFLMCRFKNKQSSTGKLFVRISIPPNDGLIFLCIWIAVNLASYSSYPDNPLPLSCRYAEAALGPGSIILSFGLFKCVRMLMSWKDNKWFRKSMVFSVFGVVGIQLMFNINRTFNMKNGLGAEIVAGQLVRISANKNLSNMLVIYFNALNHGGVDSTVGNEFIQYPLGIPMKKDWLIKQLLDRKYLKGIAFISLYDASFMEAPERKNANIVEIEHVPCSAHTSSLWSRFFSKQPSKYFVLYQVSPSRN